MVQVLFDGLHSTGNKIHDEEIKQKKESFTILMYILNLL